MTVTIVLPYPDAGLSPNARTHFRAKAALARGAHDDGFIATKAAYIGSQYAYQSFNLPLRLTFHAPDKRGRDLDNAYASCKATLDGVAEALQINDRQFWPVTLRWGDVEKPGKVVLELEP